MDDKIFDQIHDVDLKKTMETSYIDYAMSVIAQRALPDVRDGLKPVQRRVLYSMIELNNGPDKPHRKCVPSNPPGLVRGFQIPARNNLMPLSAIPLAVSITCSSVSALHGPAITIGRCGSIPGNMIDSNSISMTVL